MNIILVFHASCFIFVIHLKYTRLEYDDILDKSYISCQIGQYTINKKNISSSQNLSPTISQAANYCLLDIPSL